MRIFIDLDTNQVSSNAGTRQQLDALRFKRGLTIILEVQFTRNGVVQELENGTTGIFEIKTTNHFDEQPLAGASSWVKVGTGDQTVYKFTFSLITTELDNQFNVDGNTNNDVPQLTVMSAVYWLTTFGDSESATIKTLLDNNIVRPGDTVPPTIDYLYDDSGALEIMLGDDDLAMAHDGGE